MALREAFKIFRPNIDDAAFVHDAIRDLAGGDQISQPLRDVGVVFIVISGHSTPPNKSSASTAAGAATGNVRSAIAREFFKAW